MRYRAWEQGAREAHAGVGQGCEMARERTLPLTQAHFPGSLLEIMGLLCSLERGFYSLEQSLALNANCFALLREECRHNVKSRAFCVVHLKRFLIYITLFPSPLPPPHQSFQISLEIYVKRAEGKTFAQKVKELAKGVQPVLTLGGLPLEAGVSEVTGAEETGGMSFGGPGTWFPKMERKFAGEFGSAEGSSKRRLNPFAAVVETRKCQKFYLLKNQRDSFKGETFHL
ncbi:uncharacterized protein [Saccopteryx leptura]|uniref:uncharacterized protein n=1 Tax=Saccopteryx leptura TaxID=249018 RepID=UPI00339CA19E